MLWHLPTNLHFLRSSRCAVTPTDKFALSEELEMCCDTYRQICTFWGARGGSRRCRRGRGGWAWWRRGGSAHTAVCPWCWSCPDTRSAGQTPWPPTESSASRARHSTETDLVENKTVNKVIYSFSSQYQVKLLDGPLNPMFHITPQKRICLKTGMEQASMKIPSAIGCQTMVCEWKVK